MKTQEAVACGVWVEFLDARGHTVAQQIVALGDHVAEVDAHAEHQPALRHDLQHLAVHDPVPAPDRGRAEVEPVPHDGDEVVLHEPGGEQRRLGERAPHLGRRVGQLLLDDDRLLGLVRSELRDLLGAVGSPQLVQIDRWHGAMPQYTVGHVDRVSRIRSLVAAHPGLALAGAAYEGVGIPQVIASGQAAAAAVVGTG